LHIPEGEERKCLKTKTSTLGIEPAETAETAEASRDSRDTRASRAKEAAETAEIQTAVKSKQQVSRDVMRQQKLRQKVK
jgi:hypothetical protein